MVLKCRDQVNFSYPAASEELADAFKGLVASQGAIGAAVVGENYVWPARFILQELENTCSKQNIQN